MDIAFLFWSIAVGIVLAAGLLFLAVLGSAFVGLVLWWFARRRGGESPYILVLHCADAQTEDAAKALVDSAVKEVEPEEQSVTPGRSSSTMRSVSGPGMRPSSIPWENWTG